MLYRVLSFVQVDHQDMYQIKFTCYPQSILHSTNLIFEPVKALKLLNLSRSSGKLTWYWS